MRPSGRQGGSARWRAGCADHQRGGVRDSSFGVPPGQPSERWQAGLVRLNGQPRWDQRQQRLHSARREGTGFCAGVPQRKFSRAAANSAAGNRWRFQARPLAPAGVAIERMLVVEACGGFQHRPGQHRLQECRHHGFRWIRCGCSSTRFSSHEVKEHPYDMWSFQGSSYDWGKDDVLRLTRTSWPTQQ